MSIESPKPYKHPSPALESSERALRLSERTILIAMLVAAAASVVLTLRAGQRNPSLLLKTLFVLWVLSPFVCMAATATKAPLWHKQSRLALTALMLLLSFASVALYAAVVFGPPRAQPAAMFLLVPFVSWLSIALLFAFTALKARKPPTPF